MKANQKGPVALRVFMAIEDLSIKQLAAQIGCAPQAVTRWRKGLYQPAREQAALLEELTNGAVPASLWRDEARRLRRDAQDLAA